MQWDRPSAGLPVLFACLCLTAAYGEQPAGPPEQQEAPPHRRGILRLIPTYQTEKLGGPYKPLTGAEKFKLATHMSTSPGSIFLAAVLAGRAQWADATPDFGQGVKGYARYFGAGYTDTAMGNYLSEAIFPSLLHQDPRFFRSGAGSGWRRIGYALGQVVRTRADSGAWQFNYSELGGNAAGVAISTAYYPDRRTASEAATRFGLRLAFDAGGNILKEFWPDINRHLFARKRRTAPGGH